MLLEQRISLIQSNLHSLKRAKDNNRLDDLASFFEAIRNLAAEGFELYAAQSESSGEVLPPGQSEGAGGTSADNRIEVGTTDSKA